MTIIAVVGATGRTGLCCIRSLSLQGYQVRALCRTQEKFDKVAGDIKVESVVPCDITDKSTLKGALDGVDVVVCATGRPEGGKNAPKTYPTELIEYDGVKNLIDSCVEANVSKFIYVGAAFMTRPYSLISLFLNYIVDGVLAYKLKLEKYMRQTCIESGMEYVAVRPVGLVDKPASAFAISQGDVVSTATIPRASVAEAITAIIGATYKQTDARYEHIKLPEHLSIELEAGPNADKSVETMNWQNTLNGLVPDQGPEELPHYTTHINALNNVKTGFKVFFGVCAAAVIGGVTYALMR